MYRSRLNGGVSPTALAPAVVDWAGRLAGAPGTRMRLATRAWSDAAAFAVRATRGPDRPGDEGAAAADRRFAAAAWRQWPFNVLAEASVTSEQWWAEATTGVPGVAPHDERVVAFWARQMLAALSPVNYPWSNPEVLEATIRELGANLWHGGALAARDGARALSGDGPAPEAIPYVPGESVAVTPGRVVFRNHLIELIQYAPTTGTVHPEPVLIVPAWIMKYYILDLSPHNSLVRYLVGQGHTVFMISWRNPGAEDRDLGMEDYLRQGPMAALDVIGAIAGDVPVHAAGYCLGGTLLAIAAAAMARDGDERLASVTMFAAQTDFTEPGEIEVFVDEAQVTELEGLMDAQGYLDSRQMGGAFAMLRAHDLIYGPAVAEYLLGVQRTPNDLMSWNADGTRLPARMHSEYLRGLFLHNDLFEGRQVAGGRPVSLGDIRVPMFAVATVADHVAPWRSVYKLSLAARSPLTFLLTSGGHNAGIVSEPGHPRRSYQCTTQAPGEPHVDPERWRAQTPTETGSWWPEWQRWLARHSGPPVADPPALARRGARSLGDAPGTYVMVR